MVKYLYSFLTNKFNNIRIFINLSYTCRYIYICFAKPPNLFIIYYYFCEY